MANPKETLQKTNLQQEEGEEEEKEEIDFSDKASWHLDPAEIAEALGFKNTPKFREFLANFIKDVVGPTQPTLTGNLKLTFTRKLQFAERDGIIIEKAD